jgi:hypothetical protein
VPPERGEQRGCACRLTGHPGEEPGSRVRAVLGHCVSACAGTPRPGIPAPSALLGPPRWLLHTRRESHQGTGAAPLPRLTRTGAPQRRSQPLAEAGTRGQHHCEAAEETPPVLGTHHPGGASAARRVWCSTLRWHRCPAITSAHATDCRRRQALESGKKCEPSAHRSSVSLDKGSPHTG